MNLSYLHRLWRHRGCPTHVSIDIIYKKIERFTFAMPQDENASPLVVRLYHTEKVQTFLSNKHSCLHFRLFIASNLFFSARCGEKYQMPAGCLFTQQTFLQKKNLGNETFWDLLEGIKTVSNQQTQLEQRNYLPGIRLHATSKSRYGHSNWCLFGPWTD